ncbi:MAG: TraR/DksA C4-type zinc finger protein [Tissierellaceae bacterium]
MNKDKLELFRKRLLKEKYNLLKTLNGMENMKEFGSMDIYHSELSNYDNHPADIGTELFMMEQDNGFKNGMKSTISEIDDSLNDINKGTYGICRECGNKISEDRLDAIPYVKTCVDCTDKKDSIIDKDMDNRQFISLKRGKGSSFSDTTEDMVQLDREDTYQKVAQYNHVHNDPSFHTGDNLNVMDEEDLDGDGI